MDDGRTSRDRLLPFLLSRPDAPAPAREPPLEAVLGGEMVEQPTKGRRQCLVGGYIRPPQRVPAARRQDARRQDGAEWGRLDERYVGVPIVVVGQIARTRLD